MALGFTFSFQVTEYVRLRIEHLRGQATGAASEDPATSGDTASGGADDKAEGGNDDDVRPAMPGCSYQNAGVLRTNAMRYFPNFLRKGQLSKLFFCFPDPHFKAKNHRRRIVSETLLTEYAYLLKPNARLYTITDVEDLHQWHMTKCAAHPMFEQLSKTELEGDLAAEAMVTETEEGKKVARAGNAKYWAVFRRRPDEEVAQTNVTGLFAGGT